MHVSENQFTAVRQSLGNAPSFVAPSKAKVAPAAVIRRLSQKSVEKHFDAYLDIDWNAPSHVIDPRDPRFELSAEDPLSDTDWYRSQSPERRARLGLHKIVAQMQLGLEFENVLCRGLLEFVTTLEPGAPELRYAYHEVIEESQHTLMFQEAVRRSGLEARGLGALERFGARQVVRLGRTFPELFFMFVLGGEAPIDGEQRRALASRRELHPLVERIMRIHVTEEARHLCFARTVLQERVPKLGAVRMFQLRVRTPIILGTMAGMMMRVPGWLAREYGIPSHVLEHAYGSAEHRSSVLAGLEPVRRLAVDLGVAAPPFTRLWKTFGIWPGEACRPPAARSPSAS
jgi:hypothetical protein